MWRARRSIRVCCQKAIPGKSFFDIRLKFYFARGYRTRGSFMSAFLCCVMACHLLLCIMSVRVCVCVSEIAAILFACKYVNFVESFIMSNVLCFEYVRVTPSLLPPCNYMPFILSCLCCVIHRLFLGHPTTLPHGIYVLPRIHLM